MNCASHGFVRLYTSLGIKVFRALTVFGVGMGLLGDPENKECALLNASFLFESVLRVISMWVTHKADPEIFTLHWLLAPVGTNTAARVPR
jgi:hypothetical protein